MKYSIIKKTLSHAVLCGFAVLVLFSCRPTKKFYSVLLPKELLQQTSIKEFDRFVFEYDPKMLGGNVLTVTAFNQNGQFLDQPYNVLQRVKTEPFNRLKIAYYGHLVLTPKKIADLKIDVNSDYILIPYQYKDNYVGYRLRKLDIKTLNSESLDPSPPAPESIYDGKN